MKLYTSNFRKDGKNPLAVAISSSVPSWFKGPRLMELAPDHEWIHLAAEEFRPLYDRQLAKLDARKIGESLPEGSVLLCWESEGEFCHRQMVARWLRGAGFEVSEKKQVPKRGDRTPTLF